MSNFILDIGGVRKQMESASFLKFCFRKKKAHTETVSKLEDMARAGAVITDNPDGSVTFKVTETSSALGPVTQQPVIPGSGQQYRLMVDQRTGRVLGSLPGALSAVAKVVLVLLEEHAALVSQQLLTPLLSVGLLDVSDEVINILETNNKLEKNWWL